MPFKAVIHPAYAVSGHLRSDKNRKAKIQAPFRGYLVRKAEKAMEGARRDKHTDGAWIVVAAQRKAKAMAKRLATSVAKLVKDKLEFIQEQGMDSDWYPMSLFVVEDPSRSSITQ